MSDGLSLIDILEARDLVRQGRPYQPHVLSSMEALRWCHLTDHKIEVCCHCAGDHDTCRRLLVHADEETP